MAGRGRERRLTQERPRLPENPPVPRAHPALAFALVAMEGPDRYSQVGGLGVRVTQLARALAQAQCQVDLFFLGAPDLPSEEEWEAVRLHRLAQEISVEFPGGVYQGERLKLSYLAARLPRQLVEGWVAPQLERGVLPVLLFEEWQTASWARRTVELLRERDLQRRCLVLWNANNQFGFEDMDWVGLTESVGVLTISRHMRLLVEQFGAMPFVIPNGIPEEHLVPVDPAAADLLARGAGARPFLFKVGRFHPDKRWFQAIRALAQLRERGSALRLLVRGGHEHYRAEVLGLARSLGLRVGSADEPLTTVAEVAAALGSDLDSDLLELTRFLPEELLAPLYRGSVAVLANSGFEPFGLVGLETMAAGGVAVVGATGEDYARHLHNSLVMESDDPEELASAIELVATDPERAEQIRVSAREMAAAYSWPGVISGDLLPRLPLLARRQGVDWLGPAKGPATAAPPLT
ncbi:MAG: glycosyltransferase family 4 protein [Candidatus Dormibacteria bacterium]